MCPHAPADIGFVLADGLSPTALDHHGAALLAALVGRAAVTATPWRRR